MKYIRQFASHSDYESAKSSISTPNVTWDKEHVHYAKKAADTTPETEVTKYKLTIQVTDTDWGETSVNDCEYAENATISEYIEHLSTISFESSIYNADTNEEITDSSITVTGDTSGFNINGTMPKYNVKISITASSLA